MEETSMQFNQGDAATNSLNEERVEVQFGPFIAPSGRSCYLVKDSGGVSSMVWEGDLKPVQRFAVGQRVTFTYSVSGEHYELAAGPFPGDEGEPLWVLKDKDGIHDTSWEKHMVPVME